jgi:TM2 domain-containing membrane protein YozV
MTNIMQILPELEGDEMVFVSTLIKDMPDQQVQQFAAMYRSRRKNPETILILTLLGFIGIAGIHRFMLDQVGMGLLYLFTGGICLIGTIIDVVNYKRLAFEFNQKQAMQLNMIVKNMG